MNLSDQIFQDLKTAMKAGDSTKVSVLRLLRSAISYRQIDNDGLLTDEQVIQVISKEVKKRQESIVAYSDSRPDLAKKEQQELDILQTYLPPAVPDEEINQIIDQVISASGDNPQFGPTMGQVMNKLAGKVVEGKHVSVLIKDKLAG